MSEQPVSEAEGDETLPASVETWPHLVRIEFVGAMIALLILIAWSILVDAPLESPANPNRTPDPSKAPWYFVGLQELLVYFDPWIAGVVLPSLIILGLILIPYLDTNPRGNGYYTFKERPFAVSVFLSGFLGLWVLPILVGIFCRGPGWSWYWPWEPWHITKSTGAVRNLSQLLGIPDGAAAFSFGAMLVAGWYGSAILAWRTQKERLYAAGLDGWRFALVAFLLLSMAGVPIKILLRLLWDVKYVWVTPWFNL